MELKSWREELTADDKQKFTAAVCYLVDAFTALDITKERFIQLSKKGWEDSPRPFKLGMKLVRAYLISVYDLRLPEDAGWPKRFEPPAEKLLERKNYFANLVARTIKWSAANRSVMIERDKGRCTCHKTCPVHLVRK